jgi:hypothetical protein
MKFYVPFALLFLAMVSVTGCGGQQTGVVATPEEVDKYSTPAGYDPAAEQSKS